MINILSGLGYGIVSFALIVGLGVTLLSKFGTQVGGDANTTLQYLIGQLGSSGLAGWTGVIIVFVIAMTFMGNLMINKGSRR